MQGNVNAEEQNNIGYKNNLPKMSLKNKVFNFCYRHSFWWKYYFDNKADRLLQDNNFVMRNEGAASSDNVVIMFDNEVALNTTNKSGGLADRLKGMVSVYKACAETGRPFRISHTIPFELEQYLQPNVYDWRINSSDICYKNDEMELHVIRYIK